MDAAHAAEVVPRGKGVELVEPHLVGTAHHVQSRQRHRGDHRALAPADRAIATARVDDTVRQLQLQFDCAAMATGPVARRYRHARPLMDPMRHFRLLLPSGGRLYDRSEEHTSELQSLMRISYA